MTKRPQSAPSLDALFDVAAEAMEVARATSAVEAGAPQTLPIHAIRPDPLQARRILPPAVRVGFLTGRLDPPAALAAWRAMAEDDPREADLLQAQVINLAASIRAQELVNPITVYPDGQGTYLLETGERRWWAHWWLVSVAEEPAFERIRVQVVPAASPERQAAENLQDSPLTAVQEACQVARLLLHLTGRDTDHVVAILAGEGGQGNGEDSPLVGYAAYRVALELGRGDVYGKWPMIAQVMGRGERQLLRQLAILKLADGALDLADRSGLTEGQLRPLASAAAELDPARQRWVVSLVADYELPGNEVARLAKTEDLEAAEARIRRQKGLDKADAPTPAIRRPAAIMVERLRQARKLVDRHQKGGGQLSDLVDEIVASGQLETVRQEMDELAELLILLGEELDRRAR